MFIFQPGRSRGDGDGKPCCGKSRKLAALVGAAVAATVGVVTAVLDKANHADAGSAPGHSNDQLTWLLVAGGVAFLGLAVVLVLALRQKVDR